MESTADEDKNIQQTITATVLLADILGLPVISEIMDNEDMDNAVNALWRYIDTTIIDHGGMVNKHTSGTVTALWGIDQAHQNDAERAVRAALALQAAITAFRDRYNAPLTIRISINTGLVSFGGVNSTWIFSATGDAVYLADHLKQAAPVGAVLISPNTYRQVSDLFEVKPQEPLVVNGRPEPVQTYIVERTKLNSRDI